MIINHNIAALNTHRQMGSAQSAQMNSMEKLSSGLRINSAKDDAAGLAISEKMRGQIRGLEQASTNAQDGISLMQTAEGALNETHDILQRMRELAVQSANDTNTETDRGEIQKEIDSLTSEINRIGNTTEFNTKKLLNGSKEDVAVAQTKVGKAAEGAETAVKGEFSFKFADLGTLTDGQKVNVGGTDYEYKGTTPGAGQFNDATSLAALITGTYTAANGTAAAAGTITLTQGTATDDATGPAVKKADGSAVTVAVDKAGVTGKAAVTAEAGTSEFALDITKLADGQKLAIGDDEYTFKKDGTGDFKDAATLKNAIDADSNYSATIANGKVTLTQAAGKESDAVAPKVTVKTGENFSASLQIGANQSQSLEITIKDMRAGALKITGTGTGFTTDKGVSNGTDSTGTESGLDVTNATNAAKAITTIQTAIDTVSSERSKLGANQNRLEHTINNLNTSAENLTAAESRIRDVDYAEAA